MFTIRSHDLNHLYCANRDDFDLILKKSSVLTRSEAALSGKFKMEINLKMGQRLEVQDGFLNLFGESPQETFGKTIFGR